MIWKQKGFLALKQFFNNPFKKKSYTILLDSEPVSLKERQVVDIILSPKYYWTKKENLPVKYEYQAKAYAVSAFEDIIPKGSYNYLCKKEGDDFRLYAYDDGFILEKMEELGIKPQQVGKVYFAQNELKDMDIPIKLNENEVLMKHDKSIIKVPIRMVDDCTLFSDFFKNKELSNFHIKLNKFSQMVDFKVLYTIMFTLLAFMIFYAVEFVWLGQVQDEFDRKKESVSKRYKMPATSLQTKVLLKQLNKKMKDQQTLREKFYDITKLPLAKGDFLENIKYNNKRFTIILHVKNSQSGQNIQNYLQKHFKMENVNKQKDTIVYEVRYD